MVYSLRNKRPNHGNVSSFLKDRLNSTSLLSPATLSKKLFSNGESKDFFKQGSVQKSAAPFEIFTGIINDSPEIISLANFIPVYDDAGNLNKAGQVFQAKQDSLLVSAESSINSVINSNISSDLIDFAINNRNLIKTFCLQHGQEIDQLLKRFDTIKKKLDCRFPLDEQDLISIGIFPSNKNILSQDNSQLDSSLATIEEILFESNSDVITKWTPTKAWIQVILEIKEFFRNGMPRMLSDVTAPVIKSTDQYKSPYNIVSPQSSYIKKFNFNNLKYLFPEINEFTQFETDIFEQNVDRIKFLFDLKGSFGIFNKSVLSETDDIGESISRLSHLICKEYIFSTKLNPNVLTDYGYTFDITGKGNTEIWDYLFGRNGEDITDIAVNPLGAGKSLISICQAIEPDGTEVLSFENKYIKDNIGTKRPDAIITPGTYYYVESAINTTGENFDTTRLDSFVGRIKSSLDMIGMLKNDLLFKNDVIPYSSVSQKVTKKSESSGKIIENSSSKEKVKSLSSSKIRKIGDQSTYQKARLSITGPNKSSEKSTDSKDVLSNPVLLLREIEKKVFGNSGLLSRNPGPRLWTDKNFFTAQVTDVSPLLISAALEDQKLMSLLFLYVVSEMSSIRSTEISNINSELQPPAEITGPEYKSFIALEIVKRMSEVYGNSNSPFAKFRALSLQQKKISSASIYESLINQNTSLREIIHNIVKLILEYAKYFEDVENSSSNFEKFFLSNTDNNLLPTRVNQSVRRPQNSNKRTSYSGVQKTTYFAAIFELCCLMVHAANPERFTSKESTTSGFEDYIVTLVSNPVFNDAEEVKKIKKTEGNEKTVPLLFDSIMVKCENSLVNYDKTMLKQVNRLHGFIFSLYKELESYSSNLKDKFSKYSMFIGTLNSIIQDPALVRLSMSEEQLLLTRSKLLDVSTRADLSYDSEIKRSIPYFLNLKDDQRVDSLLPIEDAHLISWNLLLKDYLKSNEFRDSEGFNKKIISVGIPQGLHRLLQSDASNLSGPIRKNKLIKVHLYKTDNLKPDVIYKPLTYIFDLDRFSTRVLKNYIDSGLSILENSSFNLTKIPILKAFIDLDKSSNNSFSIFNDQKKSFEDYAFLNQTEKNDLMMNHSKSLLMEEYLNYFAGSPFDEQRYFRYDALKKIIDSEFSKFVNQNSNASVDSFESPSIESFFTGETFLSDIESFKKSLITPKKFDRVFHIIFDPDDFYIDKDLTEKEILFGKYGLDADMENFGAAKIGEVSFDTYHVAVEAYNEKDPIL